ncbi:MAG: gamma-glutamylcyclotransferase family protein [Sedimentitalea sp.]
MTDPRFFGYGSLVNLATHTYPDTQTAQVSGWRRVWVQTGERDVAFLSVQPDPNCTIAGMMATVPGGDWAALDLREAAYARHLVTAEVAQGLLEGALYVVPGASQVVCDPPASILLSYLDVVVQGYLKAFGADGAAQFFATTSGWDRPVLDDRAAPIYPRHQPLGPEETACVDRHLAQLSAVIKQRE